MKANRKKRHGYACPHVRLIDLETEAPLLANSVDEMQGDTGDNSTLQDFTNIGGITLTEPTNP